jgi:predicted small secreted protein
MAGMNPFAVFAFQTRSSIMKKLAALITVAFAFAVPLAGCNTVKGAGQDIQKGGEKMEDAAKKKQ